MNKNFIIHSSEEITRIRHAARLTAEVRDKLAAALRPGMSTLELDMLAGTLIAETGGVSAFYGYNGFPGQICISVNEEVVHGIGRSDRILQADDIVSLDVGIAVNGGVGDTAITCALGEVSDEVKRLLEGTRLALEAGIAAAICGNFVRDISFAVESVAKKHRLSVVREYVGHGCGVKLHEPPEIPNFATPFKGAKLVPGMVLAIEPMLNLGGAAVTVDRHDHWTVRTRDGRKSAHFEHLILITENQPEILTWRKMM